MFFENRKLYKSLKSEREQLESFFIDGLTQHQWFSYMLIEHSHHLMYDSGQKIKLECAKIKFFKQEFPKEYKEYEKLLERKDKINNILKDN